MDKITGLFVKLREYQRGQTMGTTITTLLGSVDTKL